MRHGLANNFPHAGDDEYTIRYRRKGSYKCFPRPQLSYHDAAYRDKA